MKNELIWTMIVMICSGSECRIYKEFPMFGMNTKQDCEWFQSVPLEIQTTKPRVPGDFIKTDCKQLPDRWTKKKT